MKACKVTIQILFSEGNFHKNNQGLLVILKTLRHDFFLYVYGLFGEKKNKEISLDFSILSQIPHGLLRGETGASSGNF